MIYLCVAFSRFSSNELRCNDHVMIRRRMFSYEHDRSLCVWCIKEWVSNGFACLCALSAKMIWWYFKCYTLLLFVLKSLLWLKTPKCHSRMNVPKWESTVTPSKWTNIDRALNVPKKVNNVLIKCFNMHISFGYLEIKR